MKYRGPRGARGELSHGSSLAGTANTAAGLVSQRKAGLYVGHSEAL